LLVRVTLLENAGNVKGFTPNKLPSGMLVVEGAGVGGVVTGEVNNDVGVDIVELVEELLPGPT